MSPESRLDNRSLLDLLRQLVSENPHVGTTQEFRDQWDAVSHFDSVETSELNELFSILMGAIRGEVQQRELQEISSLMRTQSARFDFLTTDQLNMWVDISLKLIAACKSDHAWRLDNGAEWYHDAINSVCGNATHAGLLPILLQQPSTLPTASSGFFSRMSELIHLHIEQTTESHSEPIIASLARHSIWIHQITPGWFLNDFLPIIDDIDSQSAHAFWQGFLVIRKWDLTFMRASQLDTRIIVLLRRLHERGADYEEYFGRDAARSFVFFIVELYLRTPSDEQLSPFVWDFISVERDSQLLVEWLDSVAWAIQNVDPTAYPLLAEEIYRDRFKYLIQKIREEPLKPRVVGALAEAIVGFRSEFPSAFEQIRDLYGEFGCDFGTNSRVLISMEDDSSGGYLTENFPDLSCRFLTFYLKNCQRDRSFTDWQLSEVLVKYGEKLLRDASTEFSELASLILIQNRTRTIEVNGHLFRGNADAPT